MKIGPMVILTPSQVKAIAAVFDAIADPETGPWLKHTDAFAEAKAPLGKQPKLPGNFTRKAVFAAAFFCASVSLIALLNGDYGDAAWAAWGSLLGFSYWFFSRLARPTI